MDPSLHTPHALEYYFFSISRKPMAMRTLTLLVALLLLAFETRAEPFEGSAEELLDQDLLGEDDQDMSISFGGDERTALQYAGERRRHVRGME